MYSFFFFFSSRRRHTRYWRDWSSDVCSSDLISSSGGISTEISKYVLANGGVVFGAMWNDKILVEHIEIRKIKDLDKIIGSKYVQSNISNCYKKIKNIIEKERITVAFFGLPCQEIGRAHV